MKLKTHNKNVVEFKDLKKCEMFTYRNADGNFTLGMKIEEVENYYNMVNLEDGVLHNFLDATRVLPLREVEISYEF